MASLPKPLLLFAANVVGDNHSWKSVLRKSLGLLAAAFEIFIDSGSAWRRWGLQELLLRVAGTPPFA